MSPVTDGTRRETVGANDGGIPRKIAFDDNVDKSLGANGGGSIKCSTTGEQDNPIVLVYPFVCLEGTITYGTLKKLSWGAREDVEILDAHESRQVAVREVENEQGVAMNFPMGIEIRKHDVRRLHSGWWLNDSLIDFWCLWYVCTGCVP